MTPFPSCQDLFDVREEVCPRCAGAKLDPEATRRVACRRCIGAGKLVHFAPKAGRLMGCHRAGRLQTTHGRQTR